MRPAPVSLRRAAGPAALAGLVLALAGLAAPAGADTIPGTQIGPNSVLQSQPGADFRAPKIPVIRVDPPKVSVPRLPDFPEFCTDPNLPGCFGHTGQPRHVNPCSRGQADPACR
jgi:hypothetical protein